MQKSNVLIVDDAPINRELLAFILQDHYQVFQAENGKQAIEMIESKERIYRLVLLDIQMPVMDGFGFLDYMKKKDMLKNLPVIVISGDSSDASVLHDYKDELTGGYNRSGFIQMAENILYNASDKTEYALMFLDIKNFKATNELFGTEGGDAILRDFYQRIGTTWRPAVTGRLGTDHFACLVLQSHINMDTLGNELKLNIQFKGRGMKLYGYCGIYYVEEGVSVTSMIDRAKLAEESILSDHVQPFAVFDDSMRRLYVDQMELMSEYETAIANEEFKVYYQPVVEATSGNLISAEALVRWVHPQRGLVSPAAFIPALENGGHISKLDWFIADRVAKVDQRCYAEGIPVVPVSVNLSWMDFYDEEMLQRLVELLKSDAIKKGDIRLEITETSYAALESDREKILEEFHLSGAKILLDDFGSGFSSFGMLKRYNFDILKLDMTFTRQIETSPKVCTIINGIIQMVHHLGIKVIAEGKTTVIISRAIISPSPCLRRIFWPMSRRLLQREGSDPLPNKLYFAAPCTEISSVQGVFRSRFR